MDHDIFILEQASVFGFVLFNCVYLALQCYYLHYLQKQGIDMTSSIWNRQVFCCR